MMDYVFKLIILVLIFIRLLMWL